MSQESERVIQLPPDVEKDQANQALSQAAWNTIPFRGKKGWTAQSVRGSSSHLTGKVPHHGHDR